MTRRTGNKWRIERCRSCEESHSGYTGKLDSAGTEYVVCGNTNKRMDVGVSFEGHATESVWQKEDSQEAP